MNFLKKALLFLGLILSLFASLAFTKQTSAQTGCGPSAVSFTSTATNPRIESTNQVFTLRLKNTASKTCDFTFRARGNGANIGTWTFLFHPETNENTTYHTGNKLRLTAGTEKNFKFRATPTGETKNSTKNIDLIVTSVSGPENKTDGNSELVTYKFDQPANKTCDRDPEFNVADVVNLKNPDSTIYSLSLKNIDDAGCPASIFNLNVLDLPDNWSKDFTVGNTISGVKTILVKPTKTEFFTLKVKPHQDAIAKSYPFKIRAHDKDRPSSLTIISRTYKVTNVAPPISCKNPPKVDIKPISHEGKKGDKRKYTITINNEDKKNDDNCKAETFTLKADAKIDPNNKWDRFEFEGGNKLTIKPGEDKPKDLFVTSPDNAQKGVKNLRLTVNSEKHQTRNVSFTYKVVTGDDGGGGDKCAPEKPRLEVSADKNSVKPGGKITYTVKVKNVDTGPCPKRDLSLARVFPTNSNLNGSFQPNNEFELAKGVEKTFKLEVKSPNNATLGTKKITINLKNKGGDVINKKEVDFVISNTPPTTCVKKTPEFSATPDSRTGDPGKGVKYTMAITNKDEGPCATRRLTLEAKLPTSTWRSIFAKESFDLEKAAQATIDVAITSPNGATPGDKKITLNLKNASNQIANTKDVIYVVSSPTPISCGGIAGLKCPSGYTCQYQNTPPDPDELGICVIPSPRGANLFITIEADGLGTTKRIPLGGNKNPDPDSTNLDVFLYKASDNTRSFEVNTTFTYDPDPKKEKLAGTVTLPSGFPNGIYNLYVIGPQYKLAQLPGSITLDGGDKTIENDNFNLIAGDVNKEGESYNNIDIMDYNLLLSCSIYSQDSKACDKNSNYKEYSDLNYDGIVNEDDFTLWLKEVGNQEGAQLPDE